MKKIVLLVFTFVFAFSCFSACAKNTVGDTSGEKGDEVGSTIYPKDNLIVDTHTDIQNSFIEKIRSEGIDAACDWLNTVKNGREQSYPKSMNFRWEKDGSDKYVLEVSEDMEFIDPFKIETERNFYSMGNLKIGQKYYWRVNGGEIREFETLNNGYRFIRIDDALNVRDLGGIKIKQGLIYRGTEFDENYGLTERGKSVFTEELKIKTELDLRGPSDAHLSASPFIDEVRVIQKYYRPYNEVFEERHKRTLCDIMDIFADEANYPVYIHCVGGADRTGMIAIYLRAIVGESDEDILKDYELTSLSGFAMKLTDGPDANGYRKRTTDYFVEYISMMRECVSEPTAPLETVAKKFILYCGVSEETLEKIANIIKN